MRRDRRKCLDGLRTGDARPLPARLRAQLIWELDRLELLLEHIKLVEAERDTLSRMTGRLSLAPCSALSRASEGNLRARSQARGCSGTSRTGGRSPLMPGWPHRHGAAARSIANKVFRKREIRDCVHDDPALVALPPPPARLSLVALVQRASKPERRPGQKGCHCRLGSEATRRLVEMRCQRRHDRGGRHDQGIKPLSSIPRTQSALAVQLNGPIAPLASSGDL